VPAGLEKGVECDQAPQKMATWKELDRLLIEATSNGCARFNLYPQQESLSLDRFAAAGTDDVVFVTRRGLLCRRTEVIAHARAQSVRLTSGPLQRLFGLGTVHVDAPSGPVRVAAIDRDLPEARLIVESTAERARCARAHTRSDPTRWAR